MVVIFEIEQVREFLLKHGSVWTVRDHPLKLGMNWMTDKRRGKKIADIKVEDKGPIKIENLVIFLGESGFESCEEWIETIKKLNKGTIPKNLWIHHVFLKEPILEVKK